MNVSPRPFTRRLVGLLTACGAAAGLASPALADQPTVINISGATLLENFFNKRGSTVDFIDVDGDGLARGYPTSTNDQLAPFVLPDDFPLNQVWPARQTMPWAVMYSAVGSTNGFQELINFGRSFVTVPGTVNDGSTSLRISARTAAYYNRYKFINAGSANDDNDPQFPPSTGLIFNSNNPMGAPVRSETTFIDWPTNTTPNADAFLAMYSSTAVATTSPNEGLTDVGALTIDIAPLDVPTTYAVTQLGTPGLEFNPLQVGYGNNGRTSIDKDGSQAASGTRTQKLATLTGGANLSATLPGVFNPAADANTIFDTALAWAPVAPVVNFGTGISQIDMSDLRHLFSAGRMKSGENLMVVTRDSGSGTRNAWDNSRGIDPSWGYGENVGVRNNNTTNDQLGAAYLPSNKQGNNRVEPSVFNHRLAIGYVGPERGLESSGQFWLSGGLMEIAAVRNDIAPFNGTAYSRPTLDNVLDIGPNGWVIGGPAVLATFGDPQAAPAVYGGLGWEEPYDDDNNNDMYDFGEDFLDLNNNTVRDAVEVRPGSLNPAMRNVEAAAYLNNINRSIAAFVDLPGGDQTIFTPGELAATQFILLGALPVLQRPTDPLILDANPKFNQSLQDFIRNQSGNVLGNFAYQAFGNSVAPIAPLNSRAGKVPNRFIAANTYSDRTLVPAGDTYITEGGATLASLTNLPLRNLIAGDFNGDGLRNLNDSRDLIGAWRKRNGGSWTAPNGSGDLLALASFVGTTVPGSDLSIEVVGDFNGDGSYDRYDVRYWADGLAIDPATSNLNRARGFLAVDQAFGCNFFGTVLATGRVYRQGDSAGDVANSTNRQTPNFQPIGGDGYNQPAAGPFGAEDNRIDAFDIDYVYNQFKGNGFVTDNEANWSNLAEAAGTDLSCDINGDLRVNQADVDFLVRQILQTRFGDVNLDGVVNATDTGIISAGIATPPATPGWDNGDIDGDNDVDNADLSLANANLGLGNPACLGDFNRSGSVSSQDIFDFLACFFDPNCCFADVNGVSGKTSQDIFDFLAAFFSPCTP